MVSRAVPRRTERAVEVDEPSKVIAFLKELIADPLVEKVLPEAASDVGRLSGRAFGGMILAFSSLAAGIGSLLPGDLTVNAPTLSEEVANRNNLTVRGAHALMLRADVNSRGLNGVLARKIIDIDMRGATFDDVNDVVRVLPRGSYRTRWVKRRRQFLKSLKVPALRRK